MKPLIHHLLGETRTAILAALLMRPEAPLHLRELVRMTGTSPGALHRELGALVGYGVLLREQAGRQVFYRPNPECPVLPELTGLIRKTAGIVDVLRSALVAMDDRIEEAFVYGSMAKGGVHSHSDVDVLIIGALDFNEAVQALEPTQSALRRDVNAIVLTRDQFTERLAEPGSFIAAIWKEPKLWLKGGGHEPG